MNEYFVIKKHAIDPFIIPVTEEQTNRSQKLIGYLSDVDKWALCYFIVSNKKFASKFTLYDASLLIAKLNKLNLLFYEIERYE